jgi:hypothetical protein
VRQQVLDWRRSQVLQYSSQRYSIREIAQKLQIDKSAVNRDIQFLKQQAQNNLQHHIHEVIPMEYERCIYGKKGNGAIVTDAIKYVTQKTEQIDTLKKLDERIEAMDEGESEESKESKEPDYDEEQELEEEQEKDTGELEKEGEGEGEKTTNDVF